MKRLLLVILCALLLVGIGLWWYRKAATESLLGWVLPLFSEAKVTFEIESVEPSSVKFSSVAIPENGISVKGLSFGLANLLTSGRTIELSAGEIEIDLRGKTKQRAEEGSEFSALGVLGKLRNLPNGAVTVQKSPVRFVSESENRTGAFSGEAKNSAASLEANLKLEGDLPYNFSGEISSEHSAEGERLTLGKGGNIAIEGGEFSIKAALDQPLTATRSQSERYEFLETKLDLSGSAFDNGSFPILCNSCAFVLKQGSFSQLGYNFSGALELKDLTTVLSLEGQPSPIGKVSVDGNLQGNQNSFEFTIEELSAVLFGGKVTRAKKSGEPLKPGCSSFSFKVENIEIPQLLALYPTSQVTASGALSGVVPIVYCKNSFQIVKGSLESSAGGNIKLSAPALTGNAQADLALQALRDFDYSTLKATLSMHEDGKMEVRFNIEGLSKSLDKATPLVVNLNVEENLWMLLKSLRVASQVTEQFSGGRGTK